jgi:hypothetical protein
MKKLPIISVLLIAAGLGLILYSDPVILSQGPTGSFIFNSTSTGGGLPAGNCHIVNGASLCQGSAGPGGPTSLSNTNAVIETIAGIGLCGVGLFLSAIESLSKAPSSYQTKAVT